MTIVQNRERLRWSGPNNLITSHARHSLDDNGQEASMYVKRTWWAHLFGRTTNRTTFTPFKQFTPFSPFSQLSPFTPFSHHTTYEFWCYFVGYTYNLRVQYRRYSVRNAQNHTITFWP